MILYSRFAKGYHWGTVSKCHTNLSVLFLMMTCKATIISIKISDTGTSLAVQWLRLCTSNAEGTGSIPDQGTKIPHFGCKVQPKKKKFRYKLLKLCILRGVRCLEFYFGTDLDFPCWISNYFLFLTRRSFRKPLLTYLPLSVFPPPSTGPLT